MIIVLLPILDILPYSAFIIFSYCTYVALQGRNFVKKFNVDLLQKTHIWLALSLAGVGAAILFNVVILGAAVDPFNYLIRISLIYFALLATNVLITRNAAEKDLLGDIAKTLFILVVASAFFEYGLKATGDRTVLSYFKARQDLGGIDTLHFNRFSGFWSYPGDAAAVIVLSIVLTFSLDKKFRFFKICVLIGLLLLTQSKAGIILLIFVALYYWVFSFKILHLTVFLILTAIAASYVAAIIENHFEYLDKFIDNLPFYLEKSKRAQEVLLYFKSDTIQKLASLEQRQYIYESEVFGSLSRLGLLGSLWILVPMCYAGYKIFNERNYLLIWVAIFAFFTVYLSISAGMSRFKVLIPYLVIFMAIHIKGRDRARG